jgi:hypothetical protein
MNTRAQARWKYDIWLVTDFLNFIETEVSLSYSQNNPAGTWVQLNPVLILNPNFL